MALTPSSQTRIKNPKNNLDSNALPEEAVELLASFYEDASMLRTILGKKDDLSVQFNDNEKKEKKGFFWMTSATFTKYSKNCSQIKK